MSASAAIRRARFRSRIARRPFVWIRQRSLEPGDALLVSYPRSGTTWLRFLLAEALTGTSPGFDPASNPIAYLGDQRHASRILPDGGRVIYSHETVPVGDRNVIYIVRDPRAVALSELRWLERRRLAPADLDGFIAAFTRGRSNPWGPWGAHVDAWLGSEAASHEHLRLARYEDLRSDTPAVLRDLVRFLGKDADDDRLEQAIANNTLDRMREKENRAPDEAFAKGVKRGVRFVKEGATQGWRDELSEEQRTAIERAFAAQMKRLGYDPD
ncbi:MAG: sulfotransferase domain-containing protein [Actinomycetota bacterium]